MGHVLGAEKGIFLIRGRGRPTVHGGRPCGILSISVKEVSLGSPRVGTIHVQRPTPHAPPLQIAALTENHILSSCDMLYPTEESSFFSIALVRAAGRKKVADQYVCGSSGNKPGAPYPFDGDRCLPGCLFNASCPSSLELDPYITTQTKSTSRALKSCANHR